MFLRRMGNKSKIAKDIIKYFPRHEIYIEMFFGAGGLFFNKPLAKYNFLNDFDDNILNVFTEIVINQEKLIDLIKKTSYSESVFRWLKLYQGEDKTIKALKFLYLSNFTLLGTGDTLKFTANNDKKILLQKINEYIKSEYFNKAQYLCCDFREVLNKIALRNNNEKEKTFIYLDPPYLDTRNYYIIEDKKCKWSKKDVDDLFEIAVNSGIKFAMSEFDNEYILQKAKTHQKQQSD
jgi:DNA adenine methylase